MNQEINELQEEVSSLMDELQDVTFQYSRMKDVESDLRNVQSEFAEYRDNAYRKIQKQKGLLLIKKDLISDLRGEIAALKAEVNDLTDERAEMESTPIHAELVMTQMALEVSEHKNECLKAEIENLRKINKKSAIGKDKALQ